MTQTKKRFDGLRLLIASAAFFIIVAGLREAQSILVPFFFAMFLAILGNAPLSWLKERGAPTPLAVLVVATFIFILLFAVFSFFSASLDQLRQVMPRYQERVVELRDQFAGFLDENGMISLREQLVGEDVNLHSFSDAQVHDSTESQGIFGESLLKYFRDDELETDALANPIIRSTNPLESLSPHAILTGVRGAVGGLVGAVSGVLLVSILLIFMLIEAAQFQKKIQSALDRAVDFKQLSQVAQDVQRYLGIKTITSGLTGLLVGSFTAVMGLDFALLWGLTAFILNFIPFIGSIIAAIPAIVLSLLVGGPAFAATVAAGYVVINVGISNFLEPIFLGQRLGISPLVVFLSLMFWGWVWGPSGMLLSIPLTMLMKIILEHSDEFSWIATLMGGKLTPRATFE